MSPRVGRDLAVDAGEEVADRIANHWQFSLAPRGRSGTAELTLPGVGEVIHRLRQVGRPRRAAHVRWARSAAEITLDRWDAQARRRSALRCSTPVDGSIDD